MPKRPPKKKVRSLPPHVFEKNVCWFVRRHFPTGQRYPNGSSVYLQIVRRCSPHTPERAREIYDTIGALRNGEIVEREKDVSVGSFLETYLATKRSSVAERTAEGDDELYRSYIKDTPFSRQPIRATTTMAVQEFYGSLEAKGVSGAMVRRTHRLLMSAFNLAVIWGKLAAKPKGIILPRRKETEVQFFTKDEARRFSEVCIADPQYLIFALALETGSRPGEYMGLRWSDVNFNAGTISIRQAVSFLDKGYVVKAPKTKGSRRTIRISPQLVTALAAHKERWNARVKEMKRRSQAKLSLGHFNERRGVNYEKRKSVRANARACLKQTLELDLVFASLSGGPSSPHNLGVRQMAAACKKAKVPKISLYGLRHSSITLLLTSGSDVKAIAERAGTSAAMIWKTYAHVLVESRSGAVENLASVLYGGI